MNSDEKVDILVDLPDKEIRVEGDPGWIGRTFSNLIINGMQAVEKDITPILRISLKHNEAGKILIMIADNGKGISEDIRDKIFMPNFSTKYSGSGIGLAIAKRAIEHARGKIWFDSVLGEGTVFYIELPVIS
jgi:signal transduction histidine kinase